MRSFISKAILLFLAAGAFSRPLTAAVSVTQLTPSLSAPQLVGTTITWQASATDPSPGMIDFRFSVKRVSAANFVIVRDFHQSASFQWTESGSEGEFQVKVTARNRNSGGTGELTQNFLLASRVSGTTPVVNPTAHPQVALYSARPCPSASAMRVKFWVSGQVLQTTSEKPCDAVGSMNFYIGGMLANTSYFLRHELRTGSNVVQGPVLTFTTGSIPDELPFPTITTPIPPNSQTSTQETILLHDYILSFPVVTDLRGRILWYYAAAAAPAQFGRYFIRSLGGGTFLIHMNDPTIVNPAFRYGQILREIDLAGNTLRETNASRVSEQLLARGWSQGINAFHHDAIRLPNGHTLAIGSMEKMYPAGTQGAPTEVNILGDAIVDLDQNLQVVWAWNSYQQMDINRAAVLGEKCEKPRPEGAGIFPSTICPPFRHGLTAHDWLHTNSLNYVPSTGDFIMSMRHQDWIQRIDYNNGTGSGAVLWRLGKGGDFLMDSTDPYPWFSHQHDAGYELGGTSVLSVYDNGTTRVAQTPGTSRGQVYEIDETNMTARLALNSDLGLYSGAVGNAHRLANGNYHFDTGMVSTGGRFSSIATEVLPTGAINYAMRSTVFTYRSYRLPDLYTLPNK